MNAMHLCIPTTSGASQLRFQIPSDSKTVVLAGCLLGKFSGGIAFVIKEAWLVQGERSSGLVSLF